MNRYNNPRLTNTTVSGTGMKHPMRPHVILGESENGFIRGDLLDANAVIKLIKNAARATGVLEELEQSDWINYNATINDNATAEKTVGVLQEGEVGFKVSDGGKSVCTLSNGQEMPVGYASGAGFSFLVITDDKAFGLTLENALNAGYVVDDVAIPSSLSSVNYTDVKDKELKYATVGNTIIV